MVEAEVTEVHVEAVILREREGERELVVLGSEQWTETVARLIQHAPAPFPESDPVPPGALVRAVTIGEYAGEGHFKAHIHARMADGTASDVESRGIVGVAVAVMRGVPLMIDDAAMGGADDEPRMRDGMYDEPVDLEFASGDKYWQVTGPGFLSRVEDGHVVLVNAGPVVPEVVRSGELRQPVRPGRMLGASCRLSGDLRTAGAGDGDLFVSVADVGDRVVLYGHEHGLRGDTGWVRREVVFEVPPRAWQVVIGVRLDGPGEVHVGSLAIDVLGLAGEGPRPDRLSTPIETFQGRLRPR